MDESGKVVLISGGANGIGRAMALDFLGRGMRVAVLDVDSEAGRELEQEGILFIEGDVSEESEVQDAVDITVNEYGGLDALVNNAGIADPYSGPLEELSLEAWQDYLDVNLTGAFLLSKHTARHLRASGGSIINIASTRAIQSEPDTEAYSASKGGLVALTHAMAISLGDAVRVNCISPGWIHVNDDPLTDIDHEQHPVGRVGVARDVASLAAFLISDEAGFITGQNLVVDGGMTRKMIYEE
jgi:NAD(P)-dependent dehydrogenase (short-subunit alcohol dehydrogenase family)